MKKPPCYECEDRDSSCHSKCKKYLRWKERKDSINKRKQIYSKRKQGDNE